VNWSCNLGPSLGLTGFVINEDKVEGPSEIITFLGVKISCVERTLALPDKKLSAVRGLLMEWSVKTKGKKKDLQSLIGSLNWCSRVVQGGRTFMCELISLLCRAKEPHHCIRITKGARSNIAWWIEALNIFHGFCPFFVDIPLPSHVIATDACMSGGGAHFYDDWLYVHWESDFPSLSGVHINVLELEMVHQSALRWGHLWTGSHFLVRSDNAATIAAINKGSSRSDELLCIIEKLFWLSVKYNFRLSAKFIPGVENVLADRISCMFESPCACDAHVLLTNGFLNEIECVSHMSYLSYVALQDQWTHSVNC
jgi:hypothetical protein